MAIAIARAMLESLRASSQRHAEEVRDCILLHTYKDEIPDLS